MKPTWRSHPPSTSPTADSPPHLRLNGFRSTGHFKHLPRGWPADEKQCPHGSPPTPRSPGCQAVRAEGLLSGPPGWPLHLAITLGKFRLTLIFQKLRKAASALSKDQECPRQTHPHSSPSRPRRWTPQQGGDPRSLLPKALGNIC